MSEARSALSKMTFLRNAILLRESGPRNRNCPIRNTEPLGTGLNSRGIRQRRLDLSQTLMRFLARGSPFERGANFGDRLVAIFVQFLESLPLRLEVHGAFRRPFPINVESVGRRRTRRLRGRQRSPLRFVTTFGGRHSARPTKSGIPPGFRIRWSFPVTSALAFDHAPRSV